MPLLQIENLSVDIRTANDTFRALDRASLKVELQEIHGLVGESGSGKSLLASALLGLLPENATMHVEHISLDGIDLLSLSNKQRRKIINQNISIIFQEVKQCLNPCRRIGDQLIDIISAHEKVTYRAARKKAHELLDSVGALDHKSRFANYPHELSQGLCQRVVIALALACKPKLLIADEPTTGADVSVQSQTLKLLQDLNAQHEMAILLITHDFNILKNISNHITVMYCGQTIENGHSDAIMTSPYHPYTKAYLESLKQFAGDRKKRERIFALRGSPPDQNSLPVGCRLGPRCPFAEKKCVHMPTRQYLDKRMVRCHQPIEILSRNK